MNPHRPRCLLGFFFLFAFPLSLGADEPAQLADAVERQDHATVTALLNRETAINAKQVDGMTALHWAVYHEDEKTTELLVKAGADVKAENRYGVTPLTLACTNGNPKIVEWLLE
ncbi:MAG: ankyrin repeat domain-containing protein, partial [Planctomycetaceae bacterium]|nr:ankyrin repeat domain-containing protein [Planctomycetaceae bacterium]